MFLSFFYELRAQKLNIGLNEWLTLLSALEKGLHQSSLSGFYYLAKSLLIHSEIHFDAYDRAFAKVFAGIESDALEISDQLNQWLKDPKRLTYLSEEERQALKNLNLDELKESFYQRLKEQNERHDGGNRWFGTGGTSPFGHGGYHPTGMRIGGPGGGRSAAQVAALRRYQAYRQDLILDVRQIKVALRKLRELRRHGRKDELALDETIDQTCKNAGELELIWRGRRRNNVKVLLLMDIGGSMNPHAQVVSQLFSAACQTKHFRDFHAYYFHNCIYDRLYHDAYFRQSTMLDDIFRKYGSHYKVILVGDAMMHPMELFEMGGAIDWWNENYTPGYVYMQRLSEHFERCIWLNPESPRYWGQVTVSAIRDLFDMFPMTLEGLDAAIAFLTKAKAKAKV